ncbi:MAG: hypothetical protein A2Z15_06455 [Chloroflexi bacterium RBG_16_50_11]|nr:MAG: hypothetical protein A2Z15_06455 [Chloroflexi bacterium RBG_16_50_11]
MNLTIKMKNELIKEIKFVVERMKKVDSPSEKLYYFSAAYGIAHRILNFEYEPELAFIHNVLQSVYNMINTRISTFIKGQETPVSVPNNLFEKLEEALGEMALNIEKGDTTYLQLEKMVNLAYSTTGNGYYLYIKGMLKI